MWGIMNEGWILLFISWVLVYVGWIGWIYLLILSLVFYNVENIWFDVNGL